MSPARSLLRRPAAALPALLALALIASCGSVPQTHYYTIGRIAPERTVSQAADITVGVARFEADGIYERDNLLYRKGEYEIAVDYYRRWGVPPQVMLAEATIDYLSEAGMFGAVLRMPTMIRYDAVLAGRIVRFEEDGGRMAVALEYILRSASGNRLLWRGELSATAPVQTAENPAARVEATEQCVADILGRLADELSGARLELPGR